MTARATLKPKLEIQVAVLDQRLTSLETRNESVPVRLTTLEQRFEHMSDQLEELNEGQHKLTTVVSGIGTKITWALAVASTLWAVLQMIGPTLLRLVFP
ncbi:hypothetical protein [Pseudomonas sp. N2-11]|uniref:hypothetical protein n=1 Tax=Pseudomonas sp. N2-11 TaxID=2962038 RepID=UPI0020B87A28|nr:hypothetical protein [Pseudomonas sp. N2-11]MCP3789449.1 hypothetical protein [Pseudomonas sp. N2-11]